jgi:hypothetical protein
MRSLAFGSLSRGKQPVSPAGPLPPLCPTAPAAGIRASLLRQCAAPAMSVAASMSRTNRRVNR